MPSLGGAMASSLLGEAFAVIEGQVTSGTEAKFLRKGAMEAFFRDRGAGGGPHCRPPDERDFDKNKQTNILKFWAATNSNQFFKEKHFFCVFLKSNQYESRCRHHKVTEKFFSCEISTYEQDITTRSRTEEATADSSGWHCTNKNIYKKCVPVITSDERVM